MERKYMIARRHNMNGVTTWPYRVQRNPDAPQGLGWDHGAHMDVAGYAATKVAAARLMRDSNRSRCDEQEG